ncbi:metallophosphoesterase family protein [Pontivivens ytuae]|uniref:Serine/threonine protein phosphatase n=1 Tax=Pontivivens ytuae TaxID=2789856 RepID=A0A7S9QEA1_9RHOB|nr:metallophosphoesterase family protein [Pontivivens ytuae]QPH55838.1 serine/threonine protein phosphatase [Pontivivens ytuae]
MIRRFFRRPMPQGEPTPYEDLGPGPVYAIGDVHGHVGLLRALEQKIHEDMTARGEETARIVLIGDLVDRGADSSAVLDHVLTPQSWMMRTCLTGNHEAMFVRFLANPSSRDGWLSVGGMETLASYGIYTHALDGPPHRLRAAVETLIPDAHRAFLKAMPLGATTPGYLFVHAGIDPAVPVERQDRETLLWIRDGFLDHDGPLSRVVVHGHTPAAEPELRANRIGIDTGAGYGGPLTAVRVEEGMPPAILQVAAATGV